MVRRLAAILAADVVGYSRLISKDEAGTLSAIKELRTKLIEPKVDQYHGRIVKHMGDGALMEFPSAVEAVAFATEVQCAMAKRNAGIPKDQQIIYRIGINIGDIILEDNDILGDGVNIAARLEGLAEPGGICAAKNVIDQVKNKLDLTYELVGRRKVKNIPHTVTVYHIILDDKAAQLVTEIEKSSQDKRTWRVLGAAVLAMILIASGAVWWQLRTPVPDKTTVETADPQIKPSPRSQKSTIAILPFVNISGDKDQEYFADGMTEDLITDLSKISELTVLSRTSTSAYKGRKIDVRDIHRALGARYVVEGSVRKVDAHLRINAQLIDAVTGGHIWAERYDGDLQNIFALQDRVLGKIVESLALKLSEKERLRLASRGTDNVTAHDLYLKGVFEESKFSREGNAAAVRLYEQALSIDPKYPLPYARLSNIYQLNPRVGWSDDVIKTLRKAVELAEKAVALDDQNPRLHWILSRALARIEAPDSLAHAIKSMERAIELDPDFADAYAFLGNLYSSDGRVEDGLRSIETAIQMNERFPFWYLFMHGINRFYAEDYQEATKSLERAAERSPTAQFVRWWLAAAYAQLGRQEDAEWQVEELNSMGFEGSIKTITQTWPNLHKPFMERYVQAMRKAGIPE